MNRYDVKSIIDLSFWDNPQTRTGYPGWSGKGGSGVKELLVGHAYKFKDVITKEMIAGVFAKLDPEMGPRDYIDIYVMDLYYEHEDSAGYNPTTQVYASSRKFLVENTMEPDLVGRWVDTYDHYGEDAESPTIIITEYVIDLLENYPGLNINDFAVFFEKEITDAPVLMVIGADPILLTKKYNTWEELINTDVQEDIDACYSPAYGGYFRDRGDGYVGWGSSSYTAYVTYQPSGNDVRITDEIIYMNPDAYGTIE